MNKKGFTLIELLIVITIIGILTVLGARQFGNVTTKASVTTDFSNAQTIANAIRQAMYMDDEDGEGEAITYSIGTAETPIQIDTGETSTADKISKYMGAIPVVEAEPNYKWFVYVDQANEIVQISVGTSASDDIVLSPRQASYTGTYAAS